MNSLKIITLLLCFTSCAIFAQDSCIELFKEKYNAGQHEAAITISESCHEINENQELLYFKTRCYMYMAEYEKALSLYYNLLSNDSKNLAYLNGLGAAYYETDQNDSALHYYTIVLQVDPEHEKALKNRRLLYMLDDQYEKALIDIKKLTELFPNNSDYWTDLGDAYFFTDKEKLSEEAFDKALQLNPKNTDVFLAKADNYISVNKYEEAFSNINIGLEMTKEEPLFYELLGDYYYFKDNVHQKDALKAYLKSFKLEENPDVAYYIGICYEDLGDDKKAVKYYQKAIDLDSEDADCYTDLAYIIYDETPYKAIEFVDIAIELDPESTYAHGTKGDILYVSGFYAKAIESYTTAIDLDTSSLYYYTDRAWAYRAFGNINAALDDFTKSILYEANPTAAYFERAKTYMQQDNFELALLDLDAYINLNTRNAKAYKFRAACHYKLGNADKACSDTEIAGDLGDADARKYVKKYCQ